VLCDGRIAKGTEQLQKGDSNGGWSLEVFLKKHVLSKSLSYGPSYKQT
jgi:hypothetical protein